MIRTVEIIYKGVPLTVEGTYTSSENGYMYDGNLDGLPDSREELDINSIFIYDSEVDIYELFSWEDLNKIAEDVLNIIGY